MAGQLEQKRGEMDGEGRGEYPPTQRKGGQVKRRGGRKGKGEEKKKISKKVGGVGVFLSCLRVFVGGEGCKYTREPIVLAGLQVILLNG